MGLEAMNEILLNAYADAFHIYLPATWRSSPESYSVTVVIWNKGFTMKPSEHWMLWCSGHHVSLTH